MSEPTAFFTLEALADARRAGKQPYHEFLRSETLSAGLYELPAKGVDRQQPHLEDELYVVTAGKAMFTADGREQAVEAGSVLYVAAHVEHHFHSITEDLQVLVFFAPPETKPSG